MNEQPLKDRYNYDAFTPENVNPWMRFSESPPLGKQGPDFPLWSLDERTIRLSAVLKQHKITVLEFGSFT